MARDATTTAASTSEDGRAPSTRREAALKEEYHEVVSNFRLLTEIRFKLLALLPIAAAAAAAIGSSASDDKSSAATVLGLSIFGLAVTAGLVTYNLRNDQLYNELVGRAAHIERSLGLPDGAFANRPPPWLSIPLPRGQQWPVEHGRSVGLIYTASVALWVFMGLSAAAQLASGGQTPPWWALLAALVAAVVATVGGARRIVAVRGARSADMRAAAKLALAIAREGLPDAAASPRFQLLCAGLNDTRAARSAAFRDLVHASRKAAPRRELKRDPYVTSVIATIAKRADYYAQLHDDTARRHYGLDGSDTVVSLEARFVALITDLPPRWIDDVATGRR